MIATAMSGAMILTSCSNHDENVYNPETEKEAKHAEAVAKYQQAFVSAVGQPAADQCWDFTTGATFTSTRGANDENSLCQWPSTSAYLNGFNSKYATGNADPLPQGTLSSTVVKQADAIKAAIEAAVAKNDFKTWAPTGNYVFRTVASYRNSSTFANKDKYYSIGANFNGKNNFMAMLGVKKNGKAIKNGAAGTQHTCALVFSNVPSDATWFTFTSTSTTASFKAAEHPLTQYVEVTYDNRTFWGFKCDADGGYSDLILWVAPANITKELIIAKRYMVEDLGGATNGDIDFNDIVFDLHQYSNGEQECVVRALGGTLPISIIINNDPKYTWSKPEPVTEMINTTNFTGEEVIATFPVQGWVENKNNIQVKVKDGNDYEFITTFPENGSIPYMVAFSTNKLWNKEKVRVTPEWFTSYPFTFNFDDYINE